MGTIGSVFGQYLAAFTGGCCGGVALVCILMGLSLLLSRRGPRGPTGMGPMPPMPPPGG